MPKILTHSSKEICLVEEICLCSHGFENAHKLLFFKPNGFKSYDMGGHLVRVNRLESPVILLA